MSYNLDPKKLSKDDWLLTNCKERSLYIIENSSKTEKQLRDKLVQGKKYPEEIIDKTIEFLKKYDYINDEKYANRFIERFLNNYSKKILVQKLLQKGVKKSIIDKAIIENEDKFDEVALAKKLLNKKYPDYYELCEKMDPKEKSKIYAYLARKGIGYESISKVMKV